MCVCVQVCTTAALLYFTTFCVLIPPPPRATPHHSFFLEGSRPALVVSAGKVPGSGVRVHAGRDRHLCQLHARRRGCCKAGAAVPAEEGKARGPSLPGPGGHQGLCCTQQPAAQCSHHRATAAGATATGTRATRTLSVVRPCGVCSVALLVFVDIEKCTKVLFTFLFWKLG